MRLTQATAPSYVQEERGIIKYSNRIQGFAYGGAAALIVIIGLRSVYGRAIPSWIVIGGLLLEATLLLMIAAVYYLTPEEKGGGQPSTSSQIISGEKEILSLLRDHVLQGESEILNVLRHDLLNTQKEAVSILRNELLTAQKEIASALHNESENRIQQQEELMQALRSSAEATQQQLRSLTHIDEQITMLLKNELDNIVQAKVQEIFGALIRWDADRRIEHEPVKK